MDIWKILGLKPNSSAEQIRAAYSEKVKDFHPEDDPDGFMRLRQAYKSAIQAASGKPISDTPALKANDTSQWQTAAPETPTFDFSRLNQQHYADIGKTAKELYQYCIDNRFGSGFEKKRNEKHFSVLLEKLHPDEVVLTAFMGLHDFMSASVHDDDCAYAITNKRLIMARKKRSGEFFEYIPLKSLKNITLGTSELASLSKAKNIIATILIFDTGEKAFNVCLYSDSQVDFLLNELRRIIFDAPYFSVSDEADIEPMEKDPNEDEKKAAKQSKCRYCGGKLSSTSWACESCGKGDLKVCNKCGGKIGSLSSKCKSCKKGLMECFYCGGKMKMDLELTDLVCQACGRVRMY